MKNNILKYQNPSMVIPGGVTYPIKKLLEIVAKNSRDAQAKSGKEIITDVITGRNPSFYAEETIDGGNEIDTYLYGTPYNTENTSNVGPSYDAYLSKNFPLRKHDVKTYDAHFGDTLYIDKKYKDQVLDELEQGKTVGASMGRYAHAPSYIINTKDDKRRHYDAGGHLMQFQYDQNGNVVANMSDIYDFLPKDFEDKYGAVKEYGPLKTAAMYTMHYSGTPFVVRQNNIPVRFKEIVPEYKTEWQQRLGDFLSQWGDTYDLTLPLKLTDEEIFQIFADKEYGDDILNFMFQEGYLQPKQFKKGGSIHIKKKNRGKFTESAKRAGMEVQEYARHILANKDKYSSTLVKRANFARNAKKFKHENGGIIKYQNPSDNLPPLIQRVNKSKANFVQRLLDPNRKHIQNWVNPLSISTHKLGWATEDTKQGAFVYPEVQEINGELIDFTHPSHRRSEGINSAIERRDTVRMTPEQAKWFTENYKQYYPGFKDGGILKCQNPAEPLPQVLKTAATFPDWLRGTWSYLSGNKDSKLLESQYRPTKETNPNTKYYYRDGLNTDVIKNILGGSDYGKKNWDGENLYYKDFNDVWDRLSATGGRAERNTDNSHLGAYTIGIGEDNKGRYISYYDKFDWAPAGLPEIFHPYEIYNRIYEDEFNNTQSSLKNITYSGYNPSGKRFFKSGHEQYNHEKQ